MVEARRQRRRLSLRLDTTAAIEYGSCDVFSTTVARFVIIRDTGKLHERIMKKFIELFKKIRKPMTRPTEQHRDRSKYSRKLKHKKRDQST